jgi:hypothetical protein
MYRLITILFFLTSFTSIAQPVENIFQGGEEVKYRIHYGFLNAGYATLSVFETDKGYHFVGKGKTVGMISLFFKVKDRYESYVDKSTLAPNHFVRNISEGGYKINRDVYFDHVKNIAKVEDHKQNTTKEYPIGDVQDLMSAFYKMRTLKIDTLSVGNSIRLDLFLDAEVFTFKLVFLGNDTINSKFGEIPCYKFRPYVQSGRIFKEEESLTIWISADKNKIPVRIKADLAVGSLKIDLTSYKGLTHSFFKK